MNAKLTDNPAGKTIVRCVTTSQLAVGDIVLSHGMRVRLDERNVYGEAYGNLEPVYAFVGTVLNMDEVRADRLVPLSFLRHSARPGRDDVWIVQGNELAIWIIER